MSSSIADLRNLYYGGGSDAEYAALLAASNAGVTATSILAVAGTPAATAGTVIQQNKVVNDTNNRFQIDAAGVHSWGPGNGATDTTLARTAVGVLTASGAIKISNNVSIWTGTGAPAGGTGANGDLYIRSDGAALTTIYQKRIGTWVGIV